MCFCRIFSFFNQKQIKRFLKQIQKKDGSQRKKIVLFLSMLKFFRKEVKTTDFKNIRKVSSKLTQILQNPGKKGFFRTSRIHHGWKRKKT